MRITRSWLHLTAGLALVGALAACGDDDDDGTGPPATIDPPSLEVALVDDGVELTWSQVSGAESYDVERKTADETTFSARASGVTTTSFVDEDVEAGTTYNYRVVAVAGSDRSEPSAAAQITVEEQELPTATLTGEITDVRELSADTVYLLQGTVSVVDGAELHIPPGTLILGDADNPPTFLRIERGGKIFAEGTAEDPIVFTSSRPAGERARGDWGGVVINGHAQCNLAPDNLCTGEGGAGDFGGNDNQDDSGVLRYVRIEFVGYEVSSGNELNGLTLNGVGSGTTIEYVQVHQGLDDGIEWFGGTVNVKYAIVTGASDDSFDYSSGWQGNGQFWVAVQDPNDADQGFEIDNQDQNDTEPRTNPAVFNVTLVGKGSTGGTAGESTRGILYRLGAWGTLRNFIVTGFEIGLDIDNAATYAGCPTGDFTLASAIFFDNAELLDPDEEDAESDCTDQSPWSIAEADPQLPAAYVWPNLSDLDIVPPEGSPALSDAAAPPADDFFEQVDYIGAVAPGGTPWYQGWIETAVN